MNLLKKNIYKILIAIFLCLISSNLDTKPNTGTSFELVIQNGHTSAINDITYSPNGNFFVSASNDKTIKLWNSQGKLLRDIKGHKAGVNTVVFSPDSKYIISGSTDSSIKIWNLNGHVIRTIMGHKGKVNSVAISPDGKTIASGSSDGKIKLWNINGRLLKTLNRDNSMYVNIKSVAFSPDGKILAAGANNYYGRKDHTITLWSVSGKQIKNFNSSNGSVNVNSVEFNKDGSLIISSSGSIVYSKRDNTIKLWDLKGKLIKTFRGHRGIVTKAKFTLQGKSIISSSRDRTIKLWDLNGLLMKTIDGGPVGLNSIALSPNGKTFASASSSFFGEASSIKLWDFNGKMLKNIRGYSSRISDIAFSPVKKIIAAGLGHPENTVKLWGLDGRLVKTLKGHFYDITSISISPDGKTIATGSRDMTVKLWSIDGQLLWSFNHHGTCYSVAFSPKGDILATGSSDGSIRLWSYTGKLLKTFRGHLENIYSVEFSPHGEYIISSSKDKTVRIWNLKGKLVKLFRYKKSVSYSSFSSNGKMLATVLSGEEKIFLRKTTGLLLKTFKGSTFAFSPIEKLICIGSLDGTVKLWDYRKNRLIKTMKGVPGKIIFTPDGKSIITGSWDTTIKFWNIKTGKYISMISSGDEWLIYTDDGYFDSSRNGGSLVAMVNGTKAAGIDQFAIKYNRPDIILKRLGVHDPGLLKHYYSQYKKRLRKSGFRERDIHGKTLVPFVEIKNYAKNGKYLYINFLLIDENYNLKSYNIYVNDVPIFGAHGEKVYGNRVRRSNRIELTHGENKIEISCFNVRGSESYRTLTYVNYPEKIPVNLYYLGFGISRYKNKGLDLKFAHKDASDLEKIFKKMKGIYIKRVYTKIYLNEKVTIANIRNAKSFIRNARTADIFVLFIAGHGLYDKKGDASYYYLTYNTDINRISQTAANFELIENLLQNIKPRKKLFLMDTCESGEIDSGTLSKYFAMADSRGIRARTSRALSVVRKGRPGRSFLYQKDRFIYNDLNRRSGTIIFSSSRGGEFSYESEKIENGFFTEAIIKALSGAVAGNDNDGKISTDELREYVIESVRKQTSDMQHPTVDRDNIYQKFKLPVVK